MTDLPEGYALSKGKLRSGGHPRRPFYWRLKQRIEYRDRPGYEHMQDRGQPSNHYAIVREGQEPTEEERDRAMEAARLDIIRQEQGR